MASFWAYFFIYIDYPYDYHYHYAIELIQRDYGVEVSRVTGLDPAGPGFNFPETWYNEYDNLTDAHLWYTDAGFVDVIHTGLYIQRVFNLETYPNGYTCIFTTLRFENFC